MRSLYRLVAVALAAAAMVSFASCGGGGSAPHVNPPQPQTPAPAPPAQPNPPDITGVSPTSSVEGQSVTFSATATGGAVSSWSWDFGGGAAPTTSTAASPTVTIGAAGNYDASVTATNADGSDTFSFTLTVNPSGAPPTPPGTVSWNPAEGGTWHVEELPALPQDPNQYPLANPTFGPGGHLYGTYYSNPTTDEGDGEYRLAKLVDDTWVCEMIKDRCGGSLSFDSQGNPAISWGDHRDSSAHFAAKRGGDWEDEVVAPGGGLFAPTTQLAFDSKDRAVIAFDYLHDLAGPDYEHPLEVAKEAGAEWMVTTVDGVNSKAWADSLAIDAKDRAVIAYGYIDNETGSRELRLAVVEGSSVEVERIWVRDRDSGYSVGGASLALRPDGHAVIFFSEGNIDDFYRFLVARETDSGWEFDEIGTHRGNVRDAYLVVTREGVPVLKYTVVVTGDAYTEQSYWGWCVGDSWHIEQLPIEGYGDLLLHPGGYPVIIGRSLMSSYW